ncbi:glycosyltransferase family 2 protein [Terrisporobacter glycolicus]|uniref:Glycosyltransferase 2-like domain-containing protein n=1 Tax=Terrisporobacter glycolicus ATCC 14880 = DSM 1288 TaxID=1121315 RepID=A0ABZ2ESZ0_9FIRM|nr:glycosyltransferase family 2 protein [Terrisporobacter glycolicus]
MMDKKISIVVPVYNCEQYISKCLDSLVNQSYKNIEIIIVNDGSTDGTEKICYEYKIIDSRIKIINVDNGGVSKARNIGIENSVGDFLMFCDSDDYTSTNWCKFMLENYEENNLTVCDYYNVSDGEENDFTYDRPKIDKVTKKEDFFKLKLYGINVPWNKIYNLELIKNNKIRFDEDIFIGEDLRFNIEYLDSISENIIFLKERLYYYTLSRKDCLTNRMYKDYDKQCINQYHFIKEYMEKFKTKDKYVWNIFYNNIFLELVNSFNMNLLLKDDKFIECIKKNSHVMKTTEYQLCAKNAEISPNKICKWVYRKRNYWWIYIFNSLIKLKNR